LWFKTLYGFFVVSHASREVLHVQVTEHATAEWVAQQIVECCGWDREPLRFLTRGAGGARHSGRRYRQSPENVTGCTSHAEGDQRATSRRFS
jgi:hypothetical protein